MNIKLKFVDWIKGWCPKDSLLNEDDESLRVLLNSRLRQWHPLGIFIALYSVLLLSSGIIGLLTWDLVLPSDFITLLLTISVLLTGIFLMAFLVKTPRSVKGTGYYLRIGSLVLGSIALRSLYSGYIVIGFVVSRVNLGNMHAVFWIMDDITGLMSGIVLFTIGLLIHRKQSYLDEKVYYLVLSYGGIQIFRQFSVFARWYVFADRVNVPVQSVVGNTILIIVYALVMFVAWRILNTRSYLQWSASITRSIGAIFLCFALTFLSNSILIVLGVSRTIPLGSIELFSLSTQSIFGLSLIYAARYFLRLPKLDLSHWLPLQDITS